MKYTFLITLFFIGLTVKSVEPTAAQLEALNTAKDVKYFSQPEKEFLYYLNIARVYPKYFAKKYLIAEGHNKSSYEKSLIRTLNKTKGLEAMQPNAQLKKTARCLSEEQKKNGRTGHRRSRCKEDYYAECCAYTHEKSALSMVIQLLVDHGVPDLGHRKIMLSKKYSKAGVSVWSHKKYPYAVVVDFK